MKVPFLDLKSTHVHLEDELNEACLRVVRSGQYILGPEVKNFEEAFAAYCGVRRCVGVGNGLDALYLILAAYGIGPGDEVIVPSNTYIATWLGVSRVGATPVPVEPDRSTYNLDPNLISKSITARTKAIIPVHLYGQTAEMDPIMEIAEEMGILVVEDAAQGHGSLCRTRRAGSLGHAAAFSFYPTKNLGALGDAGAVVTNDDAIADRIRVLGNYGSRIKYYNETQGINSRLDPLQAAVLMAKLRYLDQWNSRRKEIASRYLKELSGRSDLNLPYVPDWADPVWHQFVVRHRKRDALQSHMTTQGVETLIHYPIPPHLSEAYMETRGYIPQLPIAEELAATVLSLPIDPGLSAAQIGTVLDALRAWPEEAA